MIKKDLLKLIEKANDDDEVLVVVCNSYKHQINNYTLQSRNIEINGSRIYIFIEV